MANVPYTFAYNNAHTSVVHPSTVRIHNTQLAWFYRRYLLQKVISVFDWDLPDAWNALYSRYLNISVRSDAEGVLQERKQQKLTQLP